MLSVDDFFRKVAISLIEGKGKNIETIVTYLSNGPTVFQDVAGGGYAEKDVIDYANTIKRKLKEILSDME